MAIRQCIQDIVYSTGLSGAVVHKHNTYQMIFVHKGTLHLTIAAREYTVTRPSVIFISNLEPHSIRPESDVYERYTLLIDPVAAHNQIKNPTLLSVFSNRPAGFCHVFDAAEIDDKLVFLLRMIMDEHAQEQQPFPEAETLLLRSLLILLYRHAPDGFFPFYAGIASTVWEIKQELEQNVQQEVPLNELAERYHLSPYYLAHSFKRITGYSIKQYQLFCRISVSRELLSSSDLSITQISQQSGFSDMSNFSRYFRRVMGCSPSEYRHGDNNQPDKQI